MVLPTQFFYQSWPSLYDLVGACSNCAVAIEHSLFDIACGADPGCHEGSPNPLKNIDRL